MKSIISAILVMAVSTSAMAKTEKIQFSCKQTGVESYERKTMILTQLSEGNGLEEGRWITYQLQLKEGLKDVINEKVFVRNEDVMFSFNNSKAGIKGMIYMDEMDQAWLEVDGQNMHFDCN